MQDLNPKVRFTRDLNPKVRESVSQWSTVEVNDVRHLGVQSYLIY